MSVSDQQDDCELLRRMERADEEAFAEVFRRHRRSVYRFAAHMSGSAEIADDVTQETFLMLIRDHRRYDPARGELRSFLLGIARNFVRRHLAGTRRAAPLDAEADEDFRPAATTSDLDSDPFARLARDEDLRRLDQAIRTLPAAYREILVLCELQETSYDEAARIVGCRIGTVRSRLHRARGLLAERLRAERPTHVRRAIDCLT